MSYKWKQTALQKKKYHAKALSQSAIYVNWLRMFDIQPIFSDYIWLQISAFDLTQLGLGLLYSIAPIDFTSYVLNFTHTMPSEQEMMQGIWAKFEQIDYGELHPWMLDLDSYIYENVKEEHQSDLTSTRPKAGVYGETQYGRSVYDPIVVTEFIRSTVHKMRLMRTADVSWYQFLTQIKDTLEMADITDKHLFNRLMAMFSAQKTSFVLGLSILGSSFLTETEDNFAVVPYIDAEGNIHDLKFKTLDHLQMGFILGITPLGHGLLMPLYSIYKMEDEKKNPPIISTMIEKISSIAHRLSLSTWAYTNYNKPEEMTDAHKSEKMEQYDSIQWMRRKIEDWVEHQIPSEEANSVRIRQYQNAVLQMLGWKAKRHKWGFEAWRLTTDDEFKDWWINNWTTQGLNTQTLERLFEGSKIWLPHLREEKRRLGEKIKRSRLRLSLSL